ncbi:hypothetical protein BGW36DRAFT_387314 [Talaromyces proteolyticus]|uniref:Uncharacterized protein n=1 Tax=Talaromyces proteolyticus TaxID=1131652 RepID=A0AAD4KJ78_9EURO|nr:uncharacterized protein BGW36DRAFT_387314 [Talaromyces proteolyticus]KAH8692274.1 hypothetical protein BGW36DRAFT_387314 [Talaromyces proteolyticus]
MDEQRSCESHNESDLADSLEKDLSINDCGYRRASENTLEGVAYLEVRNAIQCLFTNMYTSASPQNREVHSQMLERILQRLLFLEELHRDKTEGLIHSIGYFGSLANNTKLVVEMSKGNVQIMNDVLYSADFTEFSGRCLGDDLDRLEIMQRGLNAISVICADAQHRLLERFFGV